MIDPGLRTDGDSIRGRTACVHTQPFAGVSHHLPQSRPGVCVLRFRRTFGETRGLPGRRLAVAQWEGVCAFRGASAVIDPPLATRRSTSRAVPRASSSVTSRPFPGRSSGVVRGPVRCGAMGDTDADRDHEVRSLDLGRRQRACTRGDPSAPARPLSTERVDSGYKQTSPRPTQADGGSSRS